MKAYQESNNQTVLVFYSLILLAVTALFGCASNQPGKTTIINPAGNVQSTELSSESRADFEAAMGFIKAEDYQKSIELLTKVIKASPNQAIPHINLALAYKKLGKLNESEEQLQLALTAEPDNPVANNEYALLYRKTGRFTEARQLYEKTLEKYPNFVMVHKNLGILCDLYMKDYECAHKHYVIYQHAVQDDKTIKNWIADIQNRVAK